MQDVVNILYFPSSKPTSSTNTNTGIKTRKFEVERPFDNLPIVQHVSKSISDTDWAVSVSDRQEEPPSSSICFFAHTHYYREPGLST